ncbi:hypothetical protein DPEC_G00104020 [Dallia pectoralis]|uniref:Uncharacterized protein n=1 Tax=Dallia pectoralis TaxID=75939 RepID=A0ACC2GY24_DALPE|nr:hypothetical protein DPEC_G00104020 [Dallia pectoralis]
MGRDVQFGSESKNKSVLQQPVSVSLQAGDSVTLNCTINTETCAGEHSVYWFRHDSGESPPGIIYTHGDRSGQCKNCTETGSPTQSCVYNLPKRNLSLSDAGTYYCAVVSCGEILFGNGTKLDVGDPLGNQSNLLLSIVIPFLSTAVIINIIFCMRMKRSQCEHCTGTLSQHGHHGNVHASMSNRQSCVYNLPKRNLSLSDAGTYYCAVVSCGEILFGNGTKLDIQETVSQPGHHGNVQASMSNRQLDDVTVVNYASLNFIDKKTTQSRRPMRERREIRKQREEETIYSGLSHQDQKV